MLNRPLVTALTFALLLGPALGQSYQGPKGTLVSPSMPLPYPYTPIAPGQHNLAPTAVTALSVPPGATYATVCAAAAAVRYTTDGATTPAPTVGMSLAAGSCVSLSGAAVLSNFRALSASGALDVEYFQ
jgi:hypothetical protein